VRYTTESLRNLGVSAIDLQQLHVWDDSWTIADERLSALALRFILSNPVVTTTIPGMRHRTHVDQNLECSDSGPLDQETMTALCLHRWDRVPDGRP
jgi:aryl-alcohol dehydrogenase-like predicted oxidoreductase